MISVCLLYGPQYVRGRYATQLPTYPYRGEPCSFLAAQAWLSKWTTSRDWRSTHQDASRYAEHLMRYLHGNRTTTINNPSNKQK
ncbi:hypothetical protein BGZ63DRAFT_375427 [Mariannaea sp. PMI_226]|nr:hypothetical protein BGZ63DRAFT_375427 [Mariannaea sp. PMI_226]